MVFVKNPKDFYAGVLFIGISTIFAIGLAELPIGTAFSMDSGYFPMLLIILLVALGIALIVKGVSVRREQIGPVPWRRIALVVIPVVFFGATLKGLGLVPSLGLSVFVTTLAGDTWTLRASLLTSAALVALAWAIFLWGLGLPIPAFGPWVGGH